jgi:putative hemolysin
MARWLLDCRPLCGKRWLLGLATEPGEREEVYRLRFDIFVRECGYSPRSARGGLDRDAFDDWCDHLILWDSEKHRVIGTYRAIRGAEAMRRGGLYAGDEFDYSPLVPIADRILQGGRTCVAAEYRTSPAFQYLSYGMELLLREYGCQYFLGAESFRATDPDTLNRIYSYLRRYGSDPEWFVEPRPACRVPDLREVPVSASDERHLPALIRADLRMGFLACSPPAWDPDFGCYDVLVLGRRDRLTPAYHRLIDRIERRRPDGPPPSKPED